MQKDSSLLSEPALSLVFSTLSASLPEGVFRTLAACLPGVLEELGVLVSGEFALENWTLLRLHSMVVTRWSLNVQTYTLPWAVFKQDNRWH